MSIFYHLRWTVAEALISLALKIAEDGKEKDDFMRFFVNHLHRSVAELEADLATDEPDPAPRGQDHD